MKTLPYPIISKVDGICTAAGLQLALSADIVVASEKSIFSCPGIKLGIIYIS
jgi:enoyl-CoA hydratase/carnithine racemase